VSLRGDPRPDDQAGQTQVVPPSGELSPRQRRLALAGPSAAGSAAIPDSRPNWCLLGGTPTGRSSTMFGSATTTSSPPMVRFYCYINQADPAGVRRVADLRVRAMALSDAWVAAGCHLDDRR
jgi:hypothetical protein